MPIKTELRTITPDDARKLLTKNTKNRTLRESWVEQLVVLIREGKWATTHQGIGIAKSGRILDGQHRLNAILRSGRSVEIMVTTGMDEDDYRWIDCGKVRTNHDRIKLVEDAAVNRSCCSIVNSFLKITKGRDFTVDDLENEFLDKTDSYLYVGSAFSRPIKSITLAPVGAALALFHHHYTNKGIEAIEFLMRGVGLSEKHPILALREALIAQRVRGIHDQYWRTIAGCRAFLEGRSVKHLMASTEDFAGNVYQRLQNERSAKTAKGNESRAENKKKGAA